MAHKNEIKLRTMCRGEVMVTYIIPSMKLGEFRALIREICNFTLDQAFTVKWIDEENDPCTISSQEELNEAFHLYETNQNSELTVHIFPSVPSKPGLPCIGEDKSIYRSGVKFLTKFYKVNGHMFQAKRFNKRASCAFCSDKIWGLGRQGFKCNNCNLLVHKKCHKLLMVDCIVVPENTISDDDELVRRMSMLGKGAGNESIPTSGVKDKIKSELETVSNDPCRESYEYTLDSFNLLKVIGRGSYAKVLMAELRSTKHIYAVKVIKKELISGDADIDWIQTEKQVFQSASNYPFLVGLHSCFQTPSRLFFVMEFVRGGDLMLYMQRKRRLTEEHAAFYSAEISLALNFLHEKGIIYRDLKMENVLLDHEGHIKLTDYGMCKEGIEVGDTTSTFCGTPNYIAPEILQGENYSFGVDWWALGVLLFELLAGRSPFSIIGAAENPDQNTEDYLFHVILEETIRMPRSFSVCAKNVLRGFLNKIPAERLGSNLQSGFADITSHKFFASIDWIRLENKQMTPPFEPTLKSETDLFYFDRQLTEESVILTPDDQIVIDKIDQSEFEGFEYINPLLMSMEDSV